MSRVVLKAQDLDGYLGEGDKVSLARMDALYREAMLSFSILSSAHSEEEKRKEGTSIRKLRTLPSWSAPCSITM